MSLKCVLVDDEPDCNNLMALVLRQVGIEVAGVALNGSQGVELVSRIIPDLAIIDLKMPGMTGFEVIRQLQSTDAARHTKIVVLTAASVDTEERRALTALGALEVLQKPFRPKALTELVAKLFASA